MSRRTSRQAGAKASALVSLMRTVGTLTQPINYRGMGRVSRMLARCGGSAEAIVSLSDRSQLAIDVADYYWSRMLCEGFEYEPEVMAALDRLLTGDFAFIDCGANIGYWSIVASERLAARRVVAIEAAPATFARLTRNRALNRNRFTAINAAVFSRHGETMTFEVGGGHAAARLRLPAGNGMSDDGNPGVVEVGTTTLDEVWRRELGSHRGPVLVKLDVEGAEVAALQGAAELLATGRCHVIYEEHAGFSECAVSRHLLQHHRLDLYWLMDRPRKLTGLAELGALMVDPREGYNILAVPAGSRLAL